MKNFILIVIVLFSTCSYSNKNLQFYNIDGTEIIINKKEPITIKNFEETYFPNNKFIMSFDVASDLYSDYFETGILAVFYQEFTDKPLFILGNVPKKEQIEKALKMFNYNKYLRGYEFDYKLKSYVKERSFTIEDVYKTFGKPNRESSTSDLTFFHYKYPFLDFTIKNGYVIDYLFIKPEN